ncbi:MAG: hypothetical protein ACM3YF_04750 [Candidatus Zixiibacteriota bacterium]
MNGKIKVVVFCFWAFFSVAEGQPSREIPSVMTPQQEQAYLKGEPVDETLPAETFGYPNPERVLELSKQLELSAEQKNRIQDIIAGRQREVLYLGRKIVAEELLLDDLFRKGDENLASFYATIGNRLESIGGWRWRLRLAHLAAYAKTKAALNSGQIKKYHELRAALPAGASAK